MLLRLPLTQIRLDVTERGLNVVFPEQPQAGRNANPVAQEQSPAPTLGSSSRRREHPTAMQQALIQMASSAKPRKLKKAVPTDISGQAARQRSSQRPENTGPSHARSAHRAPDAAQAQAPSDSARYRRRLESWVNSADAGQRTARQFAAGEIDSWLKLRSRDGRWSKDLVLYALGLSDIPPLPPGVRNVDLSRNQITLLSGLQALPKSLEHLNLSGNPIMDMDPEGVVTRNPRTHVELGSARLSEQMTRIRTGLLEGATPANPSTSTPGPNNRLRNTVTRWVQAAGDDNVAARLEIRDLILSGQTHSPAVANSARPAARSTAVPAPEAAPSTHAAAGSASSTRPSRETLRQDLARWVQESDDDELMARLNAQEIILAWQDRMAGSSAASVRTGEAGADSQVPVLDLSGMGLTSLPPFPEGVESINFSRNRLTVLGGLDRLPKSVTSLQLNDNHFKSVSANIDQLNRPSLKIGLGAIDLAKEDLATLKNAGPGLQVDYRKGPDAAETPQDATGQARMPRASWAGTLSPRFEDSDTASVWASRSTIHSSDTDGQDQTRDSMSSSTSSAGTRMAFSAMSNASSRTSIAPSIASDATPEASIASPGASSSRSSIASTMHRFQARLASRPAKPDAPMPFSASSSRVEDRPGTVEAMQRNWIVNGGDAGGQRKEAVARINAWKAEASEDARYRYPLDLGGLGLNEFPPGLPAELMHLNFRDNRLATLPALASLPENLRSLDARGNPIRELPAVPLDKPHKFLVIQVDGTLLSESAKRRHDQQTSGPIYRFSTP